MRSPFFFSVILGLGLLATMDAQAVEVKEWKLTPIFKAHTIAAATQLSGPGSGVAGLPMTYDMSLFEFNWGGRQSTFNGAGITTNSNFPLTEGRAITTNTDLGAEATTPSGLVLGVQAEEYALVGNRTVGRVFGEELPWDDFDRKNGSLVPAHSNTGLDRGWLRYAEAPWSVQLVGGTLPPQTLPEFSRKTMNYVKLGSLVWRPPITNETFFEKSDWKLEEGRHPVRGGDLIADYAYAEGRHVHLELFSGQTKPTPVATVDRLSWGGRVGVDVGRGNVGVTFVRADGDQPRSEREEVWAVDTSYPLLPWLSPYTTLARTAYTRGATTLDGTAVVSGVALKGPQKIETKVQYQWLGENYDLIGTHKTEHYPTNFQGVQGETAVPVGHGMVKGVVYALRQMETNTKTGDTIFGDSYFPALANSKPGTITIWRLGGETGPWHRAKIKGYVEQAEFRKDAATDADDIHKRVINLTVGPSLAVTKSLTVEASWRHLAATGQWQAMRFRHHQEIPEVALTYVRGKDLRATVIYHYYLFEDALAASQGNNDYAGHQVLAEVRYTF